MSDWGKGILIDKEVGIITKASPTAKGEYPKRITNYDRIKEMTIEEMADALYSQEWCDNKCWGNAFMTCRRCIKEYLESEVEE